VEKKKKGKKKKKKKRKKKKKKKITIAAHCVRVSVKSNQIPEGIKD